MSEKRLTFEVVRFPAHRSEFLASLQGCGHWGHFDYFRRFVLVIAFAWGRRNVWGHLKEHHCKDLGIVSGGPELSADWPGRTSWRTWGSLRAEPPLSQSWSASSWPEKASQRE